MISPNHGSDWAQQGPRSVQEKRHWQGKKRRRQNAWSTLWHLFLLKANCECAKCKTQQAEKIKTESSPPKQSLLDLVMCRIQWFSPNVILRFDLCQKSTMFTRWRERSWSLRPPWKSGFLLLLIWRSALIIHDDETQVENCENQKY